LGFLRQLALLGCFWACSPATSWQSNTNAPNPTLNPTNLLPLSVNGFNCSLYPQTTPNKACTTVVICNSNQTNCTSITDLRVDTQTSGIHIFQDALPSTLYTSLQNISTTNGNLGNCFNYEGYSYWGNVFQAIVLLNGQKASVPIQIIDNTKTHPTTSESTNLCTSLTNTPTNSSKAHYQGIFGIGPKQQDCGSSCVSTPSIYYYSCPNGLAQSIATCTQTTVPLNQQITNPIAELAENNNGVILQLPQVPSAGVPSVEGSIILGIDTETNNASTGTQYIPTNTDTSISVSSQGQSYSAMINAAASAFTFPSTITTGTVNQITYYCPTTAQNFTSMIYGSQNIPLTFSIGNATSLLGHSSYVFAELGIPSSQNTIIYGIPFFFGKSVFVGFENRSSSLGQGPYYAF